MLLPAIAVVVVAAFVLSVASALLISTRRAASIDDGSMLDLVLDGHAHGRVAGRRSV